MSEVEALIRSTNRLVALVIACIILILATVVFHVAVSSGWFRHLHDVSAHYAKQAAGSPITWQPPDTSAIPAGEQGQLIRYGRELIMHTSLYLGPEGKAMQISNGMNCQNCHLQAGTKLFAANFSRVASTYPKFRARSGTVEGFEKRINDCLERSLNGSQLPLGSREMKAMVAYLKWVGRDGDEDDKIKGAGLISLPFLSRAADPEKGRSQYRLHCAACHGINGEGKMEDSEREWMYPPLWGPDSYNTAAGLFRISKFAAFIKANMPYGVSYDKPVLTNEEAWDIAAYVNSRPRPHKDFPQDWPDIKQKPFDYPFAPYADSLSESQHKYGPFDQILVSDKMP